MASRMTLDFYKNKAAENRHEIARLLDENKALRTALANLTPPGAGVQAYVVGYEAYRGECSYCSAIADYEPGNIDLDHFPHASDCPILQGRNALEAADAT